MTQGNTVFTVGVPDAYGQLPDTAALFGDLRRQARYHFVTHGSARSSAVAPRQLLDALSDPVEVVAHHYVARGSDAYVATLEGAVLLVTQDLVDSHGYPRLSIVVAGTKQDRVDALQAEIETLTPEPEVIEPDTNDVRLTFWSGTPTPRFDTRPVTCPTWNDIVGNYPAATRSTLAELVAATPDADGPKLVLLHGPPGVGKTTAIRALAREWSPWAATSVIVDPEEFLGSGLRYMREVVGESGTASSTRWHVVVLEDADDMVAASSRSTPSSPLVRLLNVTDGLLGQGTKLLVILTTNTDRAALHPAVTRPGRCLAAVAFTPFNRTEARHWLDQHGHRESPPTATTLADLFALTRGEALTPGHYRPGTYL